jgi:hypothetical protein
LFLEKRNPIHLDFLPGITGEQGSPPFHNFIWNIQPTSTEILFNDAHNDKNLLFSSKDQIPHATNVCIGNMQFARPLDPNKLIFKPHSDGTTELFSKQTEWVQTSADPGKSGEKVKVDDDLKVDLKFGGNGPGSSEIRHHSKYNQSGPHFLGTYHQGIGPNGENVYCINPHSIKIFNPSSHQGDSFGVYNKIKAHNNRFTF